jgi:signal transduction histidine kinase
MTKSLTQDSQAELRAEVERLTFLLEKTRAELEAKNSALSIANKEAFSYSVSHDLRNPIQAVIGFATMMLDNSHLDEEAKDYLNEVLHAAYGMGELIEDLLNFSRSTQSEIKYEIVDLSAIVKRVGKKLKERDPGREVKITVKDHVITQCDSHLMRIVFENLFTNAWKYTAKNPAAQIEFGVIADKNPIYFIRDNGAGFPQEKADKLFIPFSRLHNDTDFPGTGIGLAIVRRIVERHRGQVWAEGEVGKGATFYVSFPSDLAYS